MKVEFLSKFEKDLDDLKHAPTKHSLIALIEKLEETADFLDIPNLKKLKGYKNAYRIRVRDYRVGIFIDEGTIQLARVKHRKDIYKIFP
jgi:mRNA interferase RelE/StbE